MNQLAFVILAFNEELHIERCIKSVSSISQEVYVVDSYSKDNTVKIARSAGAKVFQNPWDNHSSQFNWALKNIEIESDWIMRIDADEILTADLAHEITCVLRSSDKLTRGYSVTRNIHFMGKLIRYGGVGWQPMVRIFAKGYGYYEDLVMDEHLLINGPVKKLKSPLIEESLVSLSSWLEKHNKYSTLEASACSCRSNKSLDERYSSTSYALSKKSQVVRWCKFNLYYRLPFFFRPLIFFLFRYVVLFGFLDGFRGFAYHFLQCFWYRLVVDLKIMESNKK